jgi:uncharacterized protein YdeI (YjbR/CyaY-like superfamily)
MAITEQFQPTRPEQWRQWLVDNHRTSSGVWFVFAKKGSGLPTLTYEQAIEEALCFGWIDSAVRKLDAKRYMLQFSPRRDRANWSEPNRKRLIRLLASSRMTDAGLAAIAPEVLRDVKAGKLAPGSPRLPTPSSFAQALKDDAAATATFESFPPSCRQQYIQWISSAKRDETRDRRVAQAMELLRRGQRLWVNGRMQTAAQLPAVGKMQPKPAGPRNKKSEAPRRSKVVRRTAQVNRGA